MHMQADLVVTDGVQDCGHLSIVCFPGNRHLIERRSLMAGQNEVPAPVVEAGHMPAVFETVVEQEDLSQEIADAPKITFCFAGTHGEFHFSVLASINLRRRFSMRSMNSAAWKFQVGFGSLRMKLTRPRPRAAINESISPGWISGQGLW